MDFLVGTAGIRDAVEEGCRLKRLACKSGMAGWVTAQQCSEVGKIKGNLQSTVTGQLAVERNPCGARPGLL